MSRSSYSDEWNGWDSIMWGWRVASAIRGKRGQKFLRELRDALDAMPVKELIAGELVDDGECCAIGCLAQARGIDVSGIDPEDAERVAATFDIAEPLAREVVYENDEFGEWTPKGRVDDPARRWEYMRKWVERRIKKSVQPGAAEEERG